MGAKWTSVRNAEPPWSRAESAAVGGVFAATAAARSTIESRGRKSSMSRDEGNRSAPIAG